MTRMARITSDGGYYHVMLRGSGRQLIFIDDEDRKAFVRMLRRAIEQDGIEVLAWCLMDNHVHVLIHDARNTLSAAMHRLATTYARYFNERNGHVGQVFQGRFASRLVETDRYLLQAVRYIHNNPVDLGVLPSQYPWSSYAEYRDDCGLTQRDLVYELVGGPDGFVGFSQERHGEDTYFFRAGTRLTDDEMQDALRVLLPGIEPSDVKTLPLGERDDKLMRLREVGFSIRQIERLTGIGRYEVERATSGRARRSGEVDDGATKGL